LTALEGKATIQDRKSSYGHRERGSIDGRMTGKHSGRTVMKTNYMVALSVLAGVAIGVVAVEGLHAQAKPKAFTITETQTLDATAQAEFARAATAAQQSAGGRSLRTGGGKIVAIDGAAPPARVILTEWDNLEQALAFYKSKAWTDLAPLRDKATKTIRRYAVEATN
jgi:uncharacterized protein (DUF1330 family)